ncbi:MAG: NAD-dependent epimerase/dehydratase family protein [Desulfobacteraceae bacterium]|nr:MAG: NAD-dependent epimerase/dehydratase family protein [Desulfobacteraceae bacterium]
MSSSNLKFEIKNLKFQRWLITGGCGFIGARLVRRLIDEGVGGIRILDNLSVGSRKDLERSLAPNAGTSEISVIVGDVRNYEACLGCCRDIDVVVHLAGNTGVAPSVLNPREDMEANVLGTFNMLESARTTGVKRFIFASSGAPIGECTPPIHEEMAPHPVSPYGAGKLAGEGYCSAYFRTFGLETVALRFGNVYGPGSTHKSSVVAKFIRQAMAEEICEIFGDGSQTRDFIYVDDLVGAVLMASIKNAAGEIFQIAANEERTINELAGLLSDILEKEFGTVMEIRHGEARLGDVKRNYSDTSKAKNLLGWKPEVFLAEGLRRTIRWFMETSRESHAKSQRKTDKSLTSLTGLV